MTPREELKRRIEIKMQGLMLLEAEHRRRMQRESEKIRKLRLQLKELEDAQEETRAAAA